MANTGRVLTTILEDVMPPCPGDCTPLGHTKPNVPSDPNYIPPEYNTTLCAVPSTTACPSLVATGIAGNIVTFELSLANSVVNNPAIAFIRLTVTQSSVPVFGGITANFPLTPKPTYWASQFAVSGSGTYEVNAEYLNSSSAVIATCNNLDIVTVP